MRKLLISTLTILLLLPTFGSFNVYKINASFSSFSRNDYNYYPMGCELKEYEVSYIEDDGSLTKVSCHSNFENAKAQMNELGEEYVVRNGYSLSPTRIVAMVNGRAYSYPGRTNSSTMSFYDIQPTNGNSYDTSTYISDRYEISYVETTYMSNNEAFLGTGYIKVKVNGFEGYCDSENVDLVPRKYIDNNLPIILGGNNVYRPSEEPFSIKMKYSYYSINDNGNYTDLKYTYYYSIPTSNSEASGSYIYVDNAQGYPFMEKDKKYYSYNGFDYYSDPYYAQESYVGTSYNYYQFMPLRSITNISADVLDSFLLNVRGNTTNSILKNQGKTFIDCQNKYGVNALLIYAMACLESSYGESPIALGYKNLFGWRAYDSSPENAPSYETVEKCIEQHMGRNLRNYLEEDGAYFYGPYIGNKGNGLSLKYSSDPYWGLKIASLAYKIDKFANNSNGKLSDYNSLNIGLIDKGSNIYLDINKSNKIYTIGDAHKYNYQYINTVYGNENGLTKIASDFAIVDGKVYNPSGFCEYNFENSVVYVDKNKVTMLYGDNVSHTNYNIDPNYAGTSFTAIDEIKLDNNSLEIVGIAGISGYNFTYDNEVIHQIKLVDLNNDSNSFVFDANNQDSYGYNLNDGYDYKYTGFDCLINLKDIEVGSYKVYVVTKIANTVSESILKTVDVNYRKKAINVDNTNYQISENSLYSYRLEIDVKPLPSELDLSKINKPSARDSLVSFDTIEIVDNKLIIDGQAMIYYLNYTNQDNVDFDVYLVSNANNYKKLDTNNYACKIPYKQLLGSSYELDNICFKAEGDIKDLDGNYEILIKLVNGEFLDICEFTNLMNEEFNDVENEFGEFDLYTSDIRNRIMLEVRKG